jgi:hypothetical protein
MLRFYSNYTGVEHRGICSHIEMFVKSPEHFVEIYNLVLELIYKCFSEVPPPMGPEIKPPSSSKLLLTNHSITQRQSELLKASLNKTKCYIKLSFNVGQQVWRLLPYVMWIRVVWYMFINVSKQPEDGDNIFIRKKTSVTTAKTWNVT